MTWQLRRANVGDLDAIMAIENEVFGTDAWSRDSMRAELADKHGYYLVAFPPGRPEQVEAYAGLRAPLREPQADIQTIAVAESARRHGLGRVLMQRMIAEARERGATEIFLEVRADNPAAQSLYESLAFEALAVRPNYYQPDGVDAIVMRHTIVEPGVTLA
jgi:ribosomal-protein-alanine acetyltransferase